MAVTWANIKDLFYEFVGDREGVHQFFTAAQLQGWLHESMREVAERTHFKDVEATQTATENLPTSNVPTYMYEVWRVEVDDEYVRPITAYEIRKQDRFWQERTGKIYWYLLDEYQTNPDTIVIRWFEIPASDAEFSIYGYGNPGLPNDSTDTNAMNVPEWFAYALLWGILARAYDADTQMRNRDISAFFRMMWDDAIMRLRIRSNGRLEGWAPDHYSTDRSLSIWNNLPRTIPEP